jgi:hypothetical protein
MITEIDDSLTNLLRRQGAIGAEVELALDAPTRDWAARRTVPTVDLYLYDIREDLRRRSAGLVDVLNDDGRVIARQEPARLFKFAYLVTAWTQRPQDEHRLLGSVLTCLVRHDAVPADCLTPTLARQERPIRLQVAAPPPENRQISDVWSSLGGDLKPSLDLVVTMPFDPELWEDLAAPVEAPLELRAGAFGALTATDDPRSARLGQDLASLLGGATSSSGPVEPPAEATSSSVDTGARPAGARPADKPASRSRRRTPEH